MDQQPYNMVSKVSACRKVQIVYYLSRGGLLEQPHLLEVSISSAEGLHLRDVKKQLTMIRGKSMPSSFSWSYKRSYKNGYVWQDLCDDDLIFPANGCDYVLKGSSISESSPNRCTTAIPEGITNEQETPADCPLKYHMSASKVTAIERSAEGGDGEDCCSMTSPESHDVSITFNFDQIHDDLLSIATRDGMDHMASGKQEVGASTMRSEGVQNEGDRMSESQVMLHEYKMYTKVASPVLVEIGADAATQTEDPEIPLNTLQSQHLNGDTSRSGRDLNEKPIELEKGEISPPPCSSCSASTTASGKLVETGSPASCYREKDEQVEQTGDEHEHDKGVIGLATPGEPTSMTSPKTSAKDDVISGVRFQEEMVAGSKTKCSSSSGFMQFVSCGGVDVKEDTMPSICLKAKGSSQPTVEHFCDLLRFGCSRKWRRTGCKMPTAPILPQNNATCEVDSLGLPPAFHNLAYAETSDDSGGKDGDVSLRCYSDQLGVALPDTMSMRIDPRSSGSSERSSNASRELILYHHKRRGAGDQRKSIPVFGSDKPITNPEDELLVNSVVSKVDQPMDFKEQLQLLAMSSGRFEPHSQSRTKFPNNKAIGLNYQNASHEAMPLLWEELVLSARRSFNNTDERPLPPGRTKADWVKALQYAEDVSLPPPNFSLCLQQCLHCGRKFRPESLNVHQRSCNNQDSRCKSSRPYVLKDAESSSQLKKTSEAPVRVEG